MSERTPVMAANWKMHKTLAEAEDFCDRFLPQVEGSAAGASARERRREGRPPVRRPLGTARCWAPASRRSTSNASAATRIAPATTIIIAATTNGIPGA